MARPPARTRKETWPSTGKRDGLQLFEIGQRDRSADEIELEVLIGEAVADSAGDDACAARGFLTRREQAQLGVDDARFVWSNVELAAQAIEDDAVNVAVGEIEQAGDGRMGAGAAPVELAGQLAAHRDKKSRIVVAELRSGVGWMRGVGGEIVIRQ